MKTVAQELSALAKVKNIHDRYHAAKQMSDRARSVDFARRCIASDFREYLAQVHDDDLGLLITNAAGSAVKTKLLAARIRRRNKK